MFHNLKQNKAKILYLIIIFWIILTTFRAIYYFVSFIHKDISIIFSSEEEKKHLYYGEIYDLYIDIHNNLNEKNCLYLYADEGNVYFLLRYWIYPQRIYWMDGPSEKLKSKDVLCDYIILYNSSNLSNKNYILNKYKGDNVFVEQLTKKDYYSIYRIL